MNLTRRSFLQLSAAGTAAILVKPYEIKAMNPLRILVLGGTGFLGPATIASALARGHSVTMFNRGKTRPDLFPDVERLIGDRDPEVGGGLTSLEGREWDVVIDNGAYHPHLVRASASLLAPRTQHYIIISSISAYQAPYPEQGTEAAPLAEMPAASLATKTKEFIYRHYGPLKVLCERAAEAALPGRVTVVRPGYIVGPEDPSGRFTYWPVRLNRGGVVAIPGERSDPIQIIDVRDLGQWLISLAEQRAIGTFNACGPDKPLSWGEVIDACLQLRANSAAPCDLVWIPSSQVLAQDEVTFPIWAPATGETRGFHTWSNARAQAAGLKFRPLARTLADTLTWYNTQAEAAGQTKLAGPLPDAEAKLIESFENAH